MRADIEGLRAVAVGTVVAFHAGLPGIHGGFLGVDVFFVISGYLITSLLLRETERTGTISLSAFYARRARRLLPAASLVLIVTGIAGWRFGLPSEWGNLSTDLITATFYVINWGLAARAVDYLAEGDSPSLLQHYWSLSVEEQFYLLWPALILAGIALARYSKVPPRRVFAALLGTVAVASFAWSVHLTAADPARAYFVTTTRVWELAIGAMLALAATRLRVIARPVGEALAAAGLVAIIVPSFLFSEATAWPGSAAAVPTLGAGAIIAAGIGRETVTGRLLSWRPFVWIGGLSYSIYLWHWPVLRIGSELIGGPGIRGRVALVLIAVVLAWLSKHLIEDPVRFAKPLARTSTSLIVAAALMAVTAGLGLALRAAVPTLKTGGVPGAAALAADTDPATAPPLTENSTLRSDPSRAYTNAGPLVPDPAVATEDIPEPVRNGCQIATDEAIRWDCTYGDPEGTVRVALLGDSKMAQWSGAMDRIAKAQGWRLDLYLKGACPVTETGENPRSPTSDCREYNKSIREAFAAQPDRRPQYAIISSNTKAGITDGVTAQVKALQDLGITVILLQNNHGPKEDVYKCVSVNPDDYKACAFPTEASDGEMLADVAQATGAPLIDPNPWICPEPESACPPAIGGALVYRQGSHLTASYLDTIVPVLSGKLTAIIDSPTRE